VNWQARVRDAFASLGHAPDSDVVDELSQHAAATYEAARADGDPHDAAERRAGDLIAAWARDAPSLRRRPYHPLAVEPPPPTGSRFAGIVQDLRYGVRLLQREPGFTAVAMLTMALGIGAATTLFSITYGVLLKPLPWPDAGRLLRLSESRKGHEPRIRGTITNGTYVAWYAQHSTIAEIGGWRSAPTTATFGDGEATRVQTAAVTPSLFSVLKATPLRGRMLVEEDGPTGGSFAARDVIVISYGLWQERFGGRDDAVGAVVQVGGRPLTVVGVMPRDFAFPDRATRAWTPWAVGSVLDAQGDRRVVIFSAMARLRTGIAPAQAAAEGTARAQSAPDPGLAAVAMFGGNGPAEIRAVPAVEMMTAEVKPALLVMLAAVALLLATATANVASLQLARATARRREMAIRAAIGADGRRITRQLIVESALVGLGGGAAGLSSAAGLHRTLPWLLPADFPRIDAVAVDTGVVLFAVGVSMAVSVACGVLPAFHARRVNLTESLSDDGSAPVGVSLRSPAARARIAIMAGQIAVSCLLLIGGALLARSFVALLHADRGYDPANLLTARIPLPASYSMERRAQLLDDLVARLASVPGVRDAGYGNALPLLSSGGFRAFTMRAPTDPSIEIDVSTTQRVVSPGYFGALALRVKAGRALSEGDTMSAPEVVVVNRSFATRYLGNRPLGAVVPNLGMCRGDHDRWEVVGVVDDMRQSGIGDEPQPEIFMPFRQIGCPQAIPDPVVVIRTAADPAPYAGVLRGLLKERAPSLALDSVMTMEERVMTTLARPRLYAVVLVGFSAFALVIAGVGLFGALSYSVAQRAREIGVRTALGARTIDIVALVARQAAMVAGAGIVTGLALAVAAARSLSAFLYGVTAYDTPTFVGVPLVMVGMAIAACVVPARRAARIDPMTAIRR
jgi:putative ABC transport system permease protein